MKKLIFIATMFLLSLNSFSQRSTYVNGYTNSNGTYVSGYYRTTPNYTRNDNYSTIGNVNPYTGSYGTKQGGLNSSFYSSSFTTPSFTTPSFTTPSFTTPSYSTPSYSTPSYYSTSGYSSNRSRTTIIYSWTY